MSKWTRLRHQRKSKAADQTPAEGSRPVAAQEAATRALRAMAVALRAFVEIGLAIGAPGASPEQAMDSRGNLNRILLDGPVFAMCTSEEREALSAPAGSWDDRTRQQFAIQHEVAATLAWALGVMNQLTAAGAISNVHDLSPIYVKVLTQAQTFLDAAALRGAGELELARDTLTLWCARGQLQIGLKKNLPVPAGHPTWEAAIRQLTSYASELGIARGSDDFLVGKRLYRDLTELESVELYSGLAKRYETLCWLTGVKPVWEQAKERDSAVAQG